MLIYKKSLILLLSLTLLCAPLTVLAENWSIIRNKNHLQPESDKGLDYVEQYGAYYVDKNAKEDDKVIYLTFDAGYENGNIEKILDTMKKHQAKGSFFILENLIIRNTDLVKRMAEEGHIVCNHTAKHKDMTKVDNINDFEAELKSLEQIYKEYTGYDMAKYYRPPEGKFNKSNLQFANELGYKTVFWSFAYADWDNNKQPSEEYAVKKIMDNTHNGMVVLLHPTSKTNADILDRVMTMWEENGYRFGSVDELTKGK